MLISFWLGAAALLQPAAIPHSMRSRFWAVLFIPLLFEKVQSCRSTVTVVAPKWGLPTIRSLVHVVFNGP